MDLNRAAATYRPVIESMVKKYPTMTPLRFAAEAKRLIQIVENARDLIGKKILDLGCGSKNTLDHAGWLTRQWNKWFHPEELARFEPWYCRLAHEAGAQVTGIDLSPNEGEQFESFQLDLMDALSLQRFDDESFDGVNNMCLTVPPESKRAHSGTSPAIMYKLRMDHEAAFDINDEIFAQVERLLKNGGVYTLSEFVFRKRKGKLKGGRAMEGLGS